MTGLLRLAAITALAVLDAVCARLEGWIDR